MSDTKRLPVFEKFIQDLRAAWAELPDTEARMKKGQQLLEELVGLALQLAMRLGQLPAERQTRAVAIRKRCRRSDQRW